MFQHCFLCGVVLLLSVYTQGQDIEHAWKAVQSLPNDTAKASRLLELANTYRDYYREQKKDNAFLTAAIQLAQQLGDAPVLAAAYHLRGVEKREQSQYILAIGYHQKALEIATRLKDGNAMATALNSIGVAYRRLDENQKAYEYHLQALQIAEANGDSRNIRISTNSIGNIQLSLGQYDQAIENFKKSLELESREKNSLGIAINLANMGAAYENLGRLDLAIDYYQRSLKYNKQINSYTGMAICNNALGAAYQKKGEDEKALQYFKQALAVNDKVDDAIHIAEGDINIGKLYSARQDTNLARKYFQKGLDIALQIHSKSMTMEAYKALAEHYRGLGDLKKAWEYMEQSQLYKDSILNEKSHLRFAEMQALYELDKKNNEIRLLQQDNKIKALQSTRNRYIALCLIVLVVLLLVGGMSYIRHSKLSAQRKNLEYELQALRSQMNPHFIFNTLNSIHRYIWANNQETASEYLTKFSRLIRIILENSQHPFVPLHAEMEALGLYLELETLRCNNKFITTIRVAPSINQELLMIPPLILQPFVENAIWHGLVHKEGEGHLYIDMRLDGEDTLLCIIEDDGIGRKKAMEIKQHKLEGQTSMGMKMTSERIHLISTLKNSKAARMEVIDLEGPEGKALGTKVVLHLPVEYLC